MLALKSPKPPPTLEALAVPAIGQAAGTSATGIRRALATVPPMETVGFAADVLLAEHGEVVLFDLAGLLASGVSQAGRVSRPLPSTQAELAAGAC